MEYVIGWVVFSLIIGVIGSFRKIGFFNAFFLSIFLSPVIGLIIALSSPTTEDALLKDEMLKNQKEQQETIKDLKGNVAEQIQQLKQLMDKGIITQDEFETQKAKLLK